MIFRSKPIIILSIGVIAMGFLFVLSELSPIEDINEMSFEEIQKIPKKDRPDLAALYDFKITKDPVLGYPPKERLLNAREHVKQFFDSRANAKSIDNVVWNERGPNNVGGRTRAVMFDPNDELGKKLWAGSVGGGLWYNEDITSNNSEWEVLNNLLPNLSISTITFDPNDTDVFYFGTGEGWGNADAIRGAGMWKSTDAGDSWEQLESMNTGFEFIQKVVVTDESSVLAAVKSNSGNSGIWRSIDAGLNWTRVIESSGADIELAGDRIYASTLTGVVYMSNDDGETWMDITPETGAGRIEIGVADNFPNIVYVVGNVGSDAAWIYKSINAGVTWSKVDMPMYYDSSTCTPSDQVFTRGQGWYDLILAVSPDNPNTVVLGGIDLYKSEDAGASWDLISYWTGSCEDYVHADQHNFIFNPLNYEIAIASNDGGVYITQDISASKNDGGPTFESRVNGYNVTQYYACALGNEPLSNIILAGAQDNGSHLFNDYGVNTTIEVTGGDGAYCFIDQEDPDLMITSYVYNNYRVSTDGMKNYVNFGLGDDSGEFINPSEYDTRTKTLYATGNANELIVYSDVFDDEILTTTHTLDLGGNSISTIELSNDEDKLFVGTYSGKVFLIDELSGSAPSATLLTEQLGVISSIDIGDDDSQILITLSNYGVTSIFESRDSGTSWQNKEGDLPDMPVRWGLYNPSNTDEVLIATEMGIWSIDDISVEDPEWEPSNEGLANVSCYMLRYRDSDGLVAVATHGRGVFTSDIFASQSVADFYFGTDIGYSEETITFINASLKSTSYEWEFGDGITSTAEHPTHSYSTSGVYDVKLIIDGDVNNSITKSIEILPKLGIDFGLSEGGDFEANPSYFSSFTKEGIGFELGMSNVGGKSGTVSGDNAWVTGLTDITYEAWTEAYLYSPGFDFSLSGSYQLEFYTKYAIEDEWDGFILEYSIDAGSSWIRLGDEVSEEWYNQEAIGQAIAFPPGQPFFSGDTGDEYIKKAFNISFLSNTDLVSFRFVFKSDPASEEAGIAIDDFTIIGPSSTVPEISISSNVVGGCAGSEIEILNTSSGDIASYTWDFGVDAFPQTATGYGPFTISYSSVGTKVVSLVAVTSGGDLEGELSIEVSNPPLDVSVSAPSSHCFNEQVPIVIENSELGINYQVVNLLNSSSLEGEVTVGTGETLTILTNELVSTSLYRVVATNSTGCSINLSNSMQVEGKNTPEVSIIEKSNGVLEATFLGADEYIWLLNDEIIEGESEKSYTPDNEGTYKVQVPNGSCIGESEPFQFLALSLEDDLTHIELYPNPVTSFVTLESRLMIESISVIDLSGSVHYEKNIKARTANLDMSFLPSATYLFQVSYGDFTEVIRLVKQ